MRMAVAAAAVAVAADLSGCALPADLPVSVAVLDVRLVGLALTEQRLATTLCVTNTNVAAVAFRRVTVALDVAGAPLATGASELPVSLPPLWSTTVPFTVVTTERYLGSQLLDLARNGSLAYRVHGTVSLEDALGLTLPFSRSGRLDLLAGGLELASAATDPARSGCSGPHPPLPPA